MYEARPTKQLSQRAAVAKLSSGSGGLSTALPYRFHRTTTPENGNDTMDLNVTAGVFMVLMIAIVTALLLCCCKTYFVCKKRRRRREFLRGNADVGRRRNHRHLPTGLRYDDSPPSYADIIQNRNAGMHVLPLSPTPNYIPRNERSVNDPKHIEDTIEVYWSIDDVTIPPPTYSCVVETSAHSSTASCGRRFASDNRLGRINRLVSTVLSRVVRTVSESVFRTRTSERTNPTTPNNNTSTRTDDQHTRVTENSTDAISAPTHVPEPNAVASTDSLSVEAEASPSNEASTASVSSISTTLAKTNKVSEVAHSTDKGVSFSATNGAFEPDSPGDSSRDEDGVTPECEAGVPSTSTILPSK